MNRASAATPAIASQTLAGRRRRAIVSSAIGTTIEWYDFFLYGIAAATVFPKLFFPQSDPFVATLLSFTTFFVGFAARPLGAALFGHYGDRIGRKALLVTTMIVMGVATTGIGLIPSYATIGFWGPVLLTVGRLFQGIAVGGEWSGSVLMAGEWTTPARRGFSTSFAQLGAPAGLFLANGALALMTSVTDDATFVAWAWRIPFLASVVLVLIGFWIRIGVFETPIFERIKADGRLVNAPVAEVLRKNWRQVALTALLRTSQQVCFYIFTTFLVTYATQRLSLGRGTVLNLVMVMALVSCITIPLTGHLSDQLGRRTITAVGCCVMLVFPFIYFRMLDSGVFGWVSLAILVSLPLQDLQYGPQAAFISESFPGSLRYSGSSLGYQLASITAGGPAPILALLLLRRFGTSTAIAVYMSACAVISLACVYLLPQHAGQLDHE